MTIGILPFATDLVATHRGKPLAAAIYSGCFMLMALAFSLLNRRVLIVRADLLVETLPLEQRRQIFRRAATASCRMCSSHRPGLRLHLPDAGDLRRAGPVLRHALASGRRS